jgi:septal ring factor EnvC (AmiA/AmiB activator)
MAFRFLVLAVLCVSSEAFSSTQSAASSTDLENAANPIRKVVTMLQMMVKKIEAEAVKEKELYDKFMCYCKTADETLGKSIGDANTKIPQLESDIKAAVEEKAQLEADLEAHQTDRDSAKAAMAKATEIREKEAAAFAKEMGESKANLDALTKALAAIEKGMAGGFLQTNAASVLRKLVLSNTDMIELDRQELTAFLSGSQSDEYAPASGEIVGILKQLKDEMDKDLNGIIAAEEAAIKSYDELMAAKKKEVEALTKAIEEKLVRSGELGVSIAQMKNDLEDTSETLAEDTKYIADLGKTCAAKTKEWDIRCKERSEELLALADTIKILNDDDALELFKKTLPSASFLQLQVSESTLRNKALGMLKDAMQGRSKKALSLDFIALALQGKKVGFEKVIKLMDEMVVTLKKEQVDDDHKKEFCAMELDLADDKKKELERSVSDSEKAIAEVEEGIATVTDEIAALETSIKDLDKSVAVATEQRKDENEEYTELMASNTAAKELILFAKNRMQKFYNPKLYKPPPKRELTEEERITLNMGGTLAPTNPPGGIAGTGVSFAQVTSHRVVSDGKAAPPPPPEASFGGKKSEESGGVLSMMDMLAAELDKEMTQADLEEKDAQGDYEKTMSDAADMRAKDSKDLTDKTATKAEMEAELQAHTDAKSATETELKATKDYIQTLHLDCDFLLEYYTERKEARASEIDAIGKAKAVLSGADFSLVQIVVKRHLRAH